VTLQLRPTFSESWYRVKNLKAKLRASAQISRQFYRGDRWYVVRDPAGNQYHRLSDPAYRFVGLLNGKRTVGGVGTGGRPARRRRADAARGHPDPQPPVLGQPDRR
jgi:hypothetical protein